MSVAARAQVRLDALPRPAFVALAAAGALALSVGFFSPKLWLLGTPAAGGLEWNRALGFLQQCREPWTLEVEPAMRWRLLPPLVAHGLGATGTSALAVPYAGLLALLGYWALAAERLLADRLAAVLLTVVLGTTGAVVTVTGWLGINDAWYLLGLSALAAGRGPVSLLLPGLLAPWVDERFLLGWPLAVCCRYWLQDQPRGFRAQVAMGAAALLPYAGIRLAAAALGHDRGSLAFGAAALHAAAHYAAYCQVGWWMGLRAAWLLPCWAACDWYRRQPGAAALGIIAALFALGTATLLAADLSRSTGVLLPMLLGGAAGLRRQGAQTCRWLAAAAAANLLMPLAMVTDTKLILVWSLPAELLRLARHRWH